MHDAIAHTDLWLRDSGSVKYRTVARLVAMEAGNMWTSLRQLTSALQTKQKTMSSALLSLESRGWIEVLRNPPQSIKDDCGAGGRHVSVYRPTSQARAVFQTSTPVTFSPVPYVTEDREQDYSTPSLLYRLIRSSGVRGMTRYRLIDLTLFLPDVCRDKALRSLLSDQLILEHCTEFYRGSVDQRGAKLPHASRLFTSYCAVF